MRGKLAGLGIGDRFEIGDDRGAGLRSLGFFEQEVLFVLGISFDVQLSGQHPLATDVDRVVDMGSSTHVLGWLDRAKIILAFAAGQKSAKTLEILIGPFLFTFAMDISTRVVGLPDFDDCVAQR